MHDPDIMLTYLEALLKHSNFTKAAGELYISQPYLTQLIKRVEKELGAMIVNRKQTPFTLTEAGQIYYQYLENVSAQRQKLNSRLERYSEQYRDREIIRITVLETLGTFLLPEIIPPFLASHNNVKAQILEGFPHQSEERILGEQAEVYMGQTPETLDNNIQAYINGGEPYYVVIPARSKFFIPGKFILDPSTYDLKTLLQEPFILSTSGSAIRRQINGIFQNYHVVPHIVVTSDSVITATNLAIHGLGLTISAASIIKRIRQQPINLYPIDPDLMHITYFIGVKKGKKLTPAIEDLIKDFQEANLNPSIH